MFSFINIAGLTVGLASFLLIINFVQYELSYDQYIENLDNTYRVNLVRNSTGAKAAAIGPPMGPAMKEQFPEVKSVVRFRHANDVLVRIEDDEYYENSIFYVDSTFLDVFTFPLVKGDRETALDQKNAVIITEELANKYFANEDPIGKSITLDDQLELVVTGVLGIPATPSHFEFEMLISFPTFEVPYGYPVTLETWGWTSFPTYVQLHEGSDPKAVNERFNAFIEENMSESAAEAITLELQPVANIHLYSKDIAERDGIPAKGDIKYVTILGAIAMLILGLAIFNFTNLSTILSLRRVKEVGVRKTLGAHRKTVFWQYSIESFVIAFISLILAVASLEIFNSYLATLFNSPLNILNYMSDHWHYLLILLLVVGFAGGAYPAVFLSSYSPVRALKNAKSSRSVGIELKTILVGLQFFITIGLVGASVVINDQMEFMRNKDLGFEKDNVLALQVQGEALTDKYSLLRQRFLQNPNVTNVSSSGNMFDGLNGSVPVTDMQNEEGDYRISLFAGNYDFVQTTGLELLKGRDFSEEYANDSSGFILNEAAVEMFGWKDSPIGKNLRVNVWEGHVIGVVKDFHFASLHENISPLVIFIPQSYVDRVFVKTKGDPQDILASLEDEWKAVFPELPFDYTFLDQHVNKLYAADQNFSLLVYTFSGLAVFLACLGLYGIIAYNISTREKEIGIRKVMGATVLNVVTVLSRQYILLILASALFAIPIAWYLLDGWLAGFAYKISITPMYFIGAVAITLVISGLTLSIRTIKAAQANPVDTLKEE
ncbi:MAG: ABC transporter permease [Fulvivirga sp.]|nr:ABC transporter permease [Fulvivirga sp.]